MIYIRAKLLNIQIRWIGTNTVMIRGWGMPAILTKNRPPKNKLVSIARALPRIIKPTKTPKLLRNNQSRQPHKTNAKGKKHSKTKKGIRLTRRIVKKRAANF